MKFQVRIHPVEINLNKIYSFFIVNDKILL